MTEEEWFEFIQRGQPAMVSVGRLSQELCSVILCSTSLVRMDHDYALKALLKHAVLPHHFRFISWAIEGGTATHDKPNHLTFFWLDGHAGWFHVTIKTNAARDELWLSTFHKTTEAKMRSKLKKRGILRPLKS